MKKQYLINVKHVDNRLVVYLNGAVIWDSGIVHEDPELNHFIDITELLTEHPHHTSELIFEGFNDSYTSNGKDENFNPWHFHYRVFSRTVDASGKVVNETDMVEPYNQKHLSNPNVKAINNKYDIVQKDGEFNVVSNALLQHFYR